MKRAAHGGARQGAGRKKQAAASSERAASSEEAPAVSPARAASVPARSRTAPAARPVDWGHEDMPHTLWSLTVVKTGGDVPPGWLPGVEKWMQKNAIKGAVSYERGKVKKHLHLQVRSLK